jgi:hypothetical protein
MGQLTDAVRIRSAHQAALLKLHRLSDGDNRVIVMGQGS